MTHAALKLVSKRGKLVRSPALIRRDAKFSTSEGAAHSVMLGLGEQYFAPFALAAGLGEVVAGLLSTVPLLVGALAQLVSPIGVAYFGSYRRWITMCASLQAAAFLPFIIAAIVGVLPVSAAFLFASIYWGSGLSISAAWNTWIGTVIPSQVRPRFFSLRNRYVHITGMCGFFLGGIILHYLDKAHAILGFAVIFSLAFLARMLSVAWLSKVSEPCPPTKKNFSPALLDVSKLFRFRSEGGRLLIYMLSVQFAVYVAAPFFTPYMLSQLKLSYAEFAVLVAATYVAKIFALPVLGRAVRREGASRALWLGGIGIVINPLLWLVSANFYYLLGIQLLSGLFWAAFELCTVLMIIDRVPESERIGVMTGYNLVNAGLVVVGSMIGATLLDTLGKNQFAYHALFALSFTLRGATLFLLGTVTVPPRLRSIPLVVFDLDVRRSIQFLTMPQLPRLLKKRRPAKDKKVA